MAFSIRTSPASHAPSSGALGRQHRSAPATSSRTPAHAAPTARPVGTREAAMRHRAGAIQAFRSTEKEQEIGGRLRCLGIFDQDSPAPLLAALRAARRAARCGGAGYDPVRHAALCRMVRAEGRRVGPAPHARPAPQAGQSI